MARFEAALDELDDRKGEAEAAFVGMGFQGLLERVGNPGVDDGAHCQRMLGECWQL